LQEGFEKIVLKAELRTTYTDYRKIEDCKLAAALQPLGTFLKENIKQSLETITPAVAHAKSAAQNSQEK
jgi:hypothetical protein